MSVFYSHWPRNVAERRSQPYALNQMSRQLNQEAGRLFSGEQQACISFYDYEAAGHGFWLTEVSSKSALSKYLERNSHPNGRNARCSFLFIQARDSRARLNITHEMLVMCCLKYDVMPELTQFLFSFGLRQHKMDFHYSGFNHREKMSTSPSDANINATASLVSSYDLCYNLKSVEESDTQDWSIRNCIFYHSFNLQEISAFWMMIKGDDLMQDRVQAATGPGGQSELSSHQTLEEAFRASLATHGLCCDWSTEQWRWYINSYEEKFEDMTRRIQGTAIRVPLTPVVDAERFKLKSRSGTIKTTQSRPSTFSRRTTMLHEKIRTFSFKPDEPEPPAPHLTFINPDDGVIQPLPPEESDDEPVHPLISEEPMSDDDPSNFSFGKLRRMHGISEALKEATLVLRHNLRIIDQLKQYYLRLPGQRGFPRRLARNCRHDISHFVDRLQSKQDEIEIQILRLGSLCESVADRKGLLHSMLDWQNTQANKAANDTMVTMTSDMNDIARQTKIETVSMKVITLVTLAFLPGTFISVGQLLLWTLMSTDIFQSKGPGDNGPNPYTHLGPVSIYLVLSLPLTAVVLIFWFLSQWWETRAEAKKKIKRIANFFGP